MTGTGRGRLAVLSLALIAGSSAAADEMPKPPEGAGSGEERVQSGKALYAEHCSHCHGFGMVNAGNVVPDLREFPPDAERRFVDTVAHGRNNRMPPWGDVLSPAEIESLWAYVRTKGK